MLATRLTTLDLASHRFAQFARQNARALVLACGLASALVFWSLPTAPETQCMLVRRSALSWHALVSLSIALTALAWTFHRSVLERVAAFRRRISAS
jgi:hypothetical protein